MRVLRPLVFVVLCLAVLGPGLRSTHAGTRPFFVGFSEDLPKKIVVAAARPAAGLGAQAIRVTLMWAPGQTRLTTRDAKQLARAVHATRGMRLALAGQEVPGTPRGAR